MSEPTRRPLSSYLEREVSEATVDAHWDEARARLEPRPRFAWRPLVVVSALVLLGFVVWLALRPATPDVGTQLIAQSAPTRASLPDGSQVELAEGTVLAFEVSRPDLVKLALTRGRARFEVTHTPGRQFVVTVDDVSVEVVGTRFIVERDDAGRVLVMVERGLVDVRVGDNLKRLSVGEQWSRDAASAPPAAPEQAPVPPVAQPLKPSPKPQPPRRPLPVVESAPADAGVVSADELFADALAARRARDWSRAAERSRAFLEAFPRDARAGLVAFELGRTLADRLGRQTEALTVWEWALQREPEADFVEDLMSRQVQLEAGRGDGAACRARRDAYLRRFPRGQFIGTVQAACGAAPP